MSYTLGVLTKADFGKIGKDKKFTTAFMNRHTFSEEEMKHYPYHLRREFYARWYGEDEEPVRIYAPDVAMARWWIAENYIRPPDELWETKTRIRELNPNPKHGTVQKNLRRASRPRLTR